MEATPDAAAHGEGTETPNNLRLAALHNGLDFIESALDYLANPGDEHGAKYAVLHLAAGIELVLKARLEREHWTLVLRDPGGAKRRDYERGDFVSANLEDVLTRLTDVCGVALGDKEQRTLRSFKKRRNQLEHFGFEANTRALQASAVSALSVVLDFIGTEFGADDLSDNENAALDRIRGALRSIDIFVQKRHDEIASRVAEKRGAGHAIVRCPTCTQVAIDLTAGRGACLFCGHSADAVMFEEEYLDALGHWSEYATVKDGGIWPVYHCLECGEQHLVFDQYSEHEAVCFACTSTWRRDELDICERCNEPYISTDEDGGMCAGCWSSVMSRE